MDNLHLSVIAVVLSFNLGSVGAKSQQILLATHHHSECRWDGEFLLNCSFTRVSTVPEDISQTAIVADFSYNNIKTFMCTDGRKEEWILKHLNLSNNWISELSLTTCTNLPVLETLNLNGNAIHTLTLDAPMPAPGSKMDRSVDHLLPALKVLSVERNNLTAVPRGLGLLQSLQTVHMSSNSIQQIDPKDFQNCSQLKDIDLQNNKITKIHPDAFKDLSKLQVVDFRENPLTIPLPQILISLNFFQLEVYLSNNARMFKCRLNAFKHLFHFPFNSTRQKWSLSYNKFANNPQKPLLYLSSSHLNCRDNVLLKRATIPTGNTSVLNCNLDNARDNEVSWWTPKGRISKYQHPPHMTLDKMNNLVIYNAEKTAEGLYLCIFNTTKEKYLIYNIQVKERVSTFLVRKVRDTNTVFRQERTESDFALAVSLSVLITFVCAFCLGAFARPYLVTLWRLMHRNKNSGSEHTYANQAFSDETLSRESSASKQTNTLHNVLIHYESSSRNTHIVPTETLSENVTGSGAHPPNPQAEYQNESNTEINMNKSPVFSEIQTNVDNYEGVNVYDNGLPSVRTEYQNSNEVTPRPLTLHYGKIHHMQITESEKSRTPPIPRRLNANPNSNHTDALDSDLAFTGETDLPFSTVRTHSVAQDSRNSKVSNSSALLQSEITKPTPDSSERNAIVSHNEPTHTTKLMHGRQSCYEQIGLNSNLNIPSDVGDCILPSISKRDTEIENLSSYETIENSPATEYDCKITCSNEKEASTDIFGDSSSDEGTPFTMSDCSSLENFEQEQPDVSDNLPACQSSLEEATTNSGTLPESPNIAAEVQHIGKNEDENTAYSETTINYGSDNTAYERASPDTDKCSGHVSMSDPDTINFHFSSQEVPGTFDYFTNAESTVQNSVSDYLHSHSTAFGNTVLSLKHSPTCDTDTENSPEEAELQLYLLPTRPQHSPSFGPTEQKENAPEGSTDKHIARNSPEQNHGGALRRNMSTSEDNDFLFAPSDSGLNEIVKKTSLLHSSNESSLQLLPEHTAEKHFMFITQQEDLLHQGKQGNTAKACADKTQRCFDEKNCDGYIVLQDTSNCSLPEETESCNLVADLLHLPTSGKTESGFTTNGHFTHQSDEDAYSFSVPQGFFNESTQYSSCSFPLKSTGNIISKSTGDSSKTEDDTTLTELENNSTSVEHLQNSSENLCQKSQRNLGHDQFFVKKKRAFDGFANILQSRTNFNS